MYTDQEGRNKTVFHRWHDCLCENPKELTKTLLGLTINYSKIVGYKVTIQKSTIFLYTTNEELEFVEKCPSEKATYSI